MSPVLQEMLGGIIRWAITFVSAYFISKGIWSDEDVRRWTPWIVTAIVSLLWNLWQKYKSRVLINTALANPPQSPEALKSQVDAGMKAPAVTPVDRVPVVTPDPNK